MSLMFIENAPKNPAYNFAVVQKLGEVLNQAIVRIDYREAAVDDNIRAQADAYIISGVPYHYLDGTAGDLTDSYQWLTDEAMTKPVAGICVGNQVLSLLFGGYISTTTIAEQGTVPLTIIEKDPVFSGLKDPFELYSDHRCWASVPSDFKLLATNEAITIDDQPSNHIMRHVSRPMYGFQAHPEQTPLGRQLLHNIFHNPDS